MKSQISTHKEAPADIYFKTKGKVVFCLDESGSMRSDVEYVLKAYNKFLDKLKNDPRVMYDFSLWSFNNKSNMKEKDKPIYKVMPLSRGNYNPDGATALYDTILESVLALDRVNPNVKVVVVVISDGRDNESRATAKDVLSLVETLSELPNWTFIYLGAYDYYERDATQMGFKPGNIANISTDNLDDILQRLADNIQGLCLNNVNKETMLLEQ